MGKLQLFEITGHVKIACVVLAESATQAIDHINNMDAEMLVRTEGACDVLDLEGAEVVEVRSIPKPYIGNEPDIMCDLAHLNATRAS